MSFAPRSILAATLLVLVQANTRATARYDVGIAPGVLEVVDLNGDGKLDLAVANEQGANVSILLGDGRDGFVAAKGSPFPAGGLPNDIATGDFNRDGTPDLAFANHDQTHLTVLLGDGQGGFSQAPHSPFEVDVKPHTHGVAAGDLNGDGAIDLITDSWGTDQVAILFGDGAGSFSKQATFLSVGRHPYQRLRLADVNGDGRSDILTTNLEGPNVSVLLADGKGGFRAATGSPFRSGDAPFNFAVGDVNADRIPDLAIVNSPSSTADRRGRDGLTVLLGDGKGSFTMMSGSPFSTGGVPNLVAIGDVDGDGVADIGITCPDANTIVLFRMNRSGALISSRTIPMAGKPKGVALRDLDGDGKADIVVSNNSQNAVTVILSR